MLYIVSTPIGNLQDITLRAIETLRSVDLIAAEDTRHSRILTRHHQIDTPLTSYFEHNKIQKAGQLIQRLKDGQSIALITDAGTPGISDPGYHLIRLARAEQIPVTVVPGPCALIAGLSLSGLPCHRFIFEGFLPVKSAARRRKLSELAGEERTVIFYESPHRLLKTLARYRRGPAGGPGGVRAGDYQEIRAGASRHRRGAAGPVYPDPPQGRTGPADSGVSSSGPGGGCLNRGR